MDGDACFFSACNTSNAMERADGGQFLMCVAPADQAELLGSLHQGMSTDTTDAVADIRGRRPKTHGQTTAGVPDTGRAMTESGRMSDVQRRANESQAVVKVHAVSDDGSKTCSFDFDVSQSTFADFQSRVSRCLQLDQFVCTYSTSPQFLAMRSINPYRQQMLTSDLELSCAVMSTGVSDSPKLYVRAHQNLGGDLLSMSRPRSLRSISVPISGDGWDLLEDSKDVVRLWRQLPSISDLPFARLLQWHQRQPMNQVTRTVHGLAQRLPLQGFEWSSYLDQRGRVVREADFRLRVFHGGVSGDLRPSAWRHILYVFPPHLTSDERETFLEKRRREYIELRNAWKNTECTPSIRSLMSTIDNDVIRTDRRNECFRDDDSPYLKSLFNILMTFALNDPVVSYVQGLNDIVAILLQVYGGDEVDTYIAFHGFMRCSRSLFTPEGLALKSGHLMALLQRFDSVFYDYLCHTKSEDLFFTYRWLLLDLKREFDQVDVMRLFEVLWSTLPPPSQYLTSLHSPSPEAAAAPGSRGLSPEAVVSVPPGQSAHGRSAGAEVTVREYGPASGDSWFVIDTLSPTVKESGVNEVSESRQRAISAVEEARDATNLSLTQSSVAHHGQAAVAADPDYKDSPVTAGATSVESSRTPSDWDVVDSTEIEIVGGGRRHVQPAARVEVDGDDTLVDIDAAEADVAPAPITESIVHSDPIEMNTGHAAVGSTQEARPSSSSQVSEEYSTYGSPLTMFVCLAILLEHRNAIMQDNLVQESIAIHFDKLRGRHDIGSILDKARTLLSDYVNSEVSTPPYSPPDASVLL